MSYNYSRRSEDSAQRPLSNPNYSSTGQYEPKYEYDSHNNGGGGGDVGGVDGYNDSSYGNNYSNQQQQQQYNNHNQQYNNQQQSQYQPTSRGVGGNGGGYSDSKAPPKKKSRKVLWITLGILLILGAIGGGVGGYFASKNSKNNAATSNGNSTSNGSNTSSAGTGNSTPTGAAGGVVVAPTATAGSAFGAILPTGHDQYGNPLYPTTTNTAAITTPTFRSNAALSCGADPYTFTNPSSLTVRPNHPVLFAPSYKWQCLSKLIQADSYMSSWDKIIMANATKFYDMTPTVYAIDGGLGGSGVLDVAREVQLRIKHWGYAWKMTNDTKWVDRTWQELLVASGNSSTQSFGNSGDNWNTQHFLDVGEFTFAFGLAYDWMFEAWTPVQRNSIMWSIINLGLRYGENAYAAPTGAGANYNWWTKVNGNWNCVCNNGLAMGALAIANEDPTGIAARILGYVVPNAAANCAQAPSSDGTWSETANYWYFGTTGHAQMAAGLLSATGSTQNLMDSNPAMKLSALYHMYVTGAQGLFAYGDTGPNKYTATANGLMFYGSQYNIPMYTLFQRDRGDAPEPMSMLFYDPQVTGSWWNGLALDAHFSNTSDAWVSMRSSWTDNNGVYVAMKSGALTGHQTHGDIDIGDFVLDAMGQRWAGELGSGNYLSDGYFSSEAQNSERWDYYRTRTEGQNTLLMGGLNQNVLAVPTTSYGSTGELQNALLYTAPKASTAFFTTDMSAAYNGTATSRAIRLINGRKQILIQDEMNVPAVGVTWIMHTNATITLSNGSKTATLALGGQTLIATLQSPATGTFAIGQCVRLSTDPVLPTDTASQDQPNPGCSTLTITLGQGQQTIQVLFNPQWSGMAASAFVTPPSVPIASWSLTSHN